ncbi:TIR domain-containing protein [Kordia periserrulae]|uniref:TIR domain-containing protein n=1 Tax=Kordia periserrulae TaxID=701523 RepID=A0A2T6BYF4_9FLAO|nr:toll/interleukin-1 receptor domain-containing protein [Kordia periserrulae]PTX61102.1 TIR domain-containing protein [Kordia periserrulae]
MKYRYDVAISFSDAQKDIAVGIHVALEKMKIESYYYLYRQEENIGIDLKSNLRKLYEEYAKLAIIIFSKDYSKGNFTRLELSAVLNRLKLEPSYLILIVCKGAKIPKSLSKLTYIEWNSDPLAIAKIVKKRLQTKPSVKSSDIKVFPNVITIGRNKHESFLADHRIDPITRQLIRVGDKVVVCEKCKLVFLKETWIVSLNGIHCNQNKTLKELPLKIDFPKIEIEKINRMMSSLNFELYTRNTGFFF